METPDSAEAQRGRGKGLGWSDDENLALCRAAAGVSQDTVRGAGMRQAQYARRIRAEFIRDTLRPVKTCPQDGTGGALDRRRWDGRTGVSCGKQWTKIEAACLNFHACGERIRRMEITWAPTKEDIARCALALYNLGAGVTLRLYDVIRPKSYPVDRKSRHTIQMEPRICSHQPSFPSSWKHSALVKTVPLLPWVPLNLWNRGCSPGTLLLGSISFLGIQCVLRGAELYPGITHCRIRNKGRYSRHEFWVSFPFCEAGNHKLWELAQTWAAPIFGPASPEETRGTDFGIWARNSAARWRCSQPSEGLPGSASS
jgi:hypothetical protein